MPNEKTETKFKQRQRKTKKDDARPRETRVGTRVDIQHQEKAQKGSKRSGEKETSLGEIAFAQ